MYNIFKSMADCDRSPIVVCNTSHTIIYMNKSAAEKYSSSGGEKLVGTSLLACHTAKANEKIAEIVAWFSESSENNMIYTYKNTAENKDVYMVALRNDLGELVGYYEKHEYRAPETAALYDFSTSLV